MLTTVDNPYDPFTEWDDWYLFDSIAGYHTPSFLGRIVRESPDMSEADQVLAVQDAIDEIVRENVSGLYRKVSKD
jgi:hypothetical protein